MSPLATHTKFESRLLDAPATPHDRLESLVEIYVTALEELRARGEPAQAALIESLRRMVTRELRYVEAAVDRPLGLR